MLIGPVKIDKLNDLVLNKAPGVYFLCRNVETAGFLGRSDTDFLSALRAAAAEKAAEGYLFFWYEEAGTAQDAFFLECRYYHQFTPTDNKTHPQSSPRKGWICPVTSCSYVEAPAENE